MKTITFYLVLLVSFAQAQSSPLTVGESHIVNHQTAHPYNPQGGTGVVFEQEFYQKEASYICLYFEDFDLGPNDYVEISSHNTGESIIYAGQGKIVDQSGTTISDFWSVSIRDERATVRLHSQGNRQQHHGFRISKVAYGYPQAQLEAMYAESKIVCGNNDRENIVCYSGTMFYQKGQAVCRIIINGVTGCTGWLLGSEGHVITNAHCIENASDAYNTEFRFDYERRSCTNIMADYVTTTYTSTLVKRNFFLDYALLSLPNNPSTTYGYLQLQPTSAAVDDRIYLVGHPLGAAKTIVLRTDRGGIPSGSGLNYASVAGLGAVGMRYFMDTDVGGSGSAVLNAQTHQVVALHSHSGGGCVLGNYASVRSDVLINDLGNLMPNDGIGSPSSPGTGNPSVPSCLTTPPHFESFDLGLGIFEQSATDDFDWTRRSGSTPTANTGPSMAAAGSHYLYIETSQQANNHLAILDGPCVDIGPNERYTVGFRYHMYGAHIGTLALQKRVNNGSWANVWSRTGNQGNQWLTASIPVPTSPGERVQFRFVAGKGTGELADIAIDDFRLTMELTSGGGGGSGLESAEFSPRDATLQVIPNPFDEMLNIQTTLPKVQGYRLTNLQGMVVQEGALNQALIPTRQLPQGIYFLTVYNEEKQLVQKVIKQ